MQNRELSPADLERSSHLLENLEQDLRALRHILLQGQASSAESLFFQASTQSPEEEAIEGVFDGQNMIGPDGKEYAIPPNYASKSKLVEGDMLKLTISERGNFVYKQTKPADRKRLIGELEKDEEGNYVVRFERKKWRVLPASITYFKGLPGDKVVLLIPQAGGGRWGAVENVIKNE